MSATNENKQDKFYHSTPKNIVFDHHKKVLSDTMKLKVAIEFLKAIITADDIGSYNGKSKEILKDEAITFINELT